MWDKTGSGSGWRVGLGERYGSCRGWIGEGGGGWFLGGGKGIGGVAAGGGGGGGFVGC